MIKQKYLSIGATCYIPFSILKHLFTIDYRSKHCERECTNIVQQTQIPYKFTHAHIEIDIYIYVYLYLSSINVHTTWIIKGDKMKDVQEKWKVFSLLPQSSSLFLLWSKLTLYTQVAFKVLCKPTKVYPTIM